MFFFFGPSRSIRRRATVTSSVPDASSAASISSSVRYLPVPRNRRERRDTPATTSGSACVSVGTRKASRPRKLPNSLVEVLLQEQRPVASVGQALDRVFEGEPEQLVDLDA